EQEVGLLALDHLGDGAGHEVGVELLVGGVDADAAVGAHGERVAHLHRDVLRADRQDHDLAELLAAVGLLVQAQRGLDRVLVEGVHDPARAGEVQRVALDLRAHLRVGDPLDGDQDLHGEPPFTKSPCSTRSPIQSATFRMSSFSPRLVTHMSASSSSAPNRARAATGGGTSARNRPWRWPSSTMLASVFRNSAKRGFRYSFMNLADCRSSIVMTSAACRFSATRSM